jgi:hypothetical protein
MEIAIVLLVITIIGAMFWSVTVSRRFSIMVFTIIFIGVAIAIIIWQGFTQRAFENLGVIAFVFLIGWLRFSKSIAETRRARAWWGWMNSNSLAVCEICGTKLSYQQIPKDLSFVIWRRYTCPNCGAESKVNFDTAPEDNAG